MRSSCPPASLCCIPFGISGPIQHWYMHLTSSVQCTANEVSGNAKIQGLEADLDMQGNDYNVALFVFFVPYILFEIPCNLILKKMAPSTWLSLIMTLWGEFTSSRQPKHEIIRNSKGVSTVGMGLVRNFQGLCAMRVLLGLFEAGLTPSKCFTAYLRHQADRLGCIYLISMYYKRYELQWRFTLFFTASIIAGAFGGVRILNNLPHRIID
jgi:hypothetical protein